MKKLTTLVQINQYAQTFKKGWFQLVKWLITLGCLFFIGWKLSLQNFTFPKVEGLGLLVVLVSVLMAVNWSLEAYRWQISVERERLTFGQAMEAVLRGVALNWVVPFTLGDLGGRIAGTQDKTYSVVALTYNRIIILLITVVFGSVSCAFYFGVGSQLAFLVMVVSVLLGLVVLLVSRDKIFGFSLRGIDWKVAGRVFLVTMVRYAVFTFQLYLLIQFFNPTLEPSVILFGVGWIFLFRSAIPSLFGNLGVREASAIVFFEPYVSDLNLVVFPCLLIWLINSVVPSIIGLVPILTFRPKLVQ